MRVEERTMSISNWLLANGDTLQITLFFALLLTFAVAERIAPRRPGSLDRAIRWPANFFLTFVNFLALGVLPVSFITAALWAEAHGWGFLNHVPLPMAIA